MNSDYDEYGDYGEFNDSNKFINIIAFLLFIEQLIMMPTNWEHFLFGNEVCLVQK